MDYIYTFCACDKSRRYPSIFNCIVGIKDTKSVSVTLLLNIINR